MKVTGCPLSTEIDIGEIVTAKDDVARATLVYTQLVSFENDQYHSAVAKSIADAQELVEQGFEFVCQINEATLFRKRK